MATHEYFSNLLCDKIDELYMSIWDYMNIYTNQNLYSGSFDKLGLTSYCTSSDGLFVKNTHRNWLWANILEDLVAMGSCYKKSVLSKNGQKVLYNIYRVVPFDNDIEYSRDYIYDNSMGKKIKYACFELFRIAERYVCTFPETIFSTKILRFICGDVDSKCTTVNGLDINYKHVNWLYFSILEQLTADVVLWKKTEILPNKRNMVTYKSTPFETFI